MTTTMISSEVVTLTVPAGQRLTVVTAASSTALVDRLRGDSPIEHASVAAGLTRVFGEYRADMEFRISCLSGTMTYAVGLDTGQTKARATATNDDGAAGDIGELLSTTVAVGAAVAETTATPVDVCTLALTPGDWDVSAVVDRALTGVTATVYAAGISLTANTMPSQAGGAGLGADPAVVQCATFGATITGNFATPIPPVRVSIAVATTIHLVGADTFSAGTVGLFGTIRARRVR